MSGLGLLATAFGSYASTLGGLYKEQVEKEQAAREKLAAEERLREWEREKTAEARAFAIDMLQRKFEQTVQLADIEHQRTLERIGYEHKLRLEEQENAVKNKQSLISKEFAAEAKAEALIEQLRIISERIADARPEERPGWIAQYNATKQALDYLLEYGEIPKGLGNAGGTPFIDPNVFVNLLANE